MDDLPVVENRALYLLPTDKNSGNPFLAAKRLEQNRRIIFEGIKNNRIKTRNDMRWMMKILPHIARFFGLTRNEVLGAWYEDYGVKLLTDWGYVS